MMRDLCSTATRGRKMLLSLDGQICSGQPSVWVMASRDVSGTAGTDGTTKQKLSGMFAEVFCIRWNLKHFNAL